ncbi:hypothetical protein D3C81_957330 [compost metagenome]
MATFVIPGTPVIKQLEMRLQQWLGNKSKYLNLAGMVAHIAENCFYGNVMSASSQIVRQIMEYDERIPVSEAEDMVDEAVDSIKRYIWRMIQVNSDDWSWHFEMTKRSDIVIYQLARCRPEGTPMDRLRQEVQAGVDNGDWYPESLRRHLGVKGDLLDI